MRIQLDYTKDAELFNKTAKGWADKIGEGRKAVHSNQLRNFYDKVLELHEKAQKRRESWEDILPFVRMLNSKVAYAKTRGHVNDDFVEMMTQCIVQVDSPQKLEIFKLFFEAVIGFYPKK